MGHKRKTYLSGFKSCAASVANDLMEALRYVLPADREVVPLHKPTFDGNEWAYIRECIDTEWVSSAGSYVDRFEEDLVDYTGAKRAVAVVNGTAALHVCLRLAGVGAGDEVLLPALTFVATANAVSYQQAIPHFVDSEQATLGVGAEKLEAYLDSITKMNDGVCVNTNTGRPIRALVPMHTYGHPVDINGLQRVCKRFNLALIEDAAESLGSLYRGRHTGTFGTCAALSFNGNKIITTGGGGAILTDDDELADRAKHLTTTAKKAHAWEYFHDQVGYNYRLPNINAALGCAQLEQLPRFLKAKRMLAERYKQAFAGIKGVSFFSEPPGARSNYWLNVVLLDRQLADTRDEILQQASSANLMLRPAWTLLHRLPMYTDCPRMDLTVAEDLEQRLINIPSTPSLVQRKPVDAHP